MFTSRVKKLSILSIIKYSIIALLIVILVVFSWLFLFIYKHLYFAIVQEVAIINLRSQLVITKVQKTEFNNLLQNFVEKQTPITTINFKALRNPFKSSNNLTEE
ncbi:hypothetical protein ACFL29_01870 [Patescibacteria group bacterium]